jgi:serine/threonine-protein kinase RsbW
MTGITGAAMASPTKDPTTSMARFAMRTLRNIRCDATTAVPSPGIVGPTMGAPATIRLTAPGTLRHRAIAVRVVAEACRLVSRPEEGPARPEQLTTSYDLVDPFDVAVVSAFAEVFNNIAIHAYQRRGTGDVELTILVDEGCLTVEIRDQGEPFDLGAVPAPELDALPEGGMGIHIARALLDEVDYEPGPPNLWRLVKRLPTVAERKTSAK